MLNFADCVKALPARSPTKYVTKAVYITPEEVEIIDTKLIFREFNTRKAIVSSHILGIHPEYVVNEYQELPTNSADDINIMGVIVTLVKVI